MTTEQKVCSNGHPWTDENRAPRQGHGTSCRLCNRDDMARLRALRKPAGPAGITTTEIRFRNLTIKVGGTFPGDWRNRAICAIDVDEVDPRYTMPSRSLSSEDREEMARTCGNCPVARKCQEWAEAQPFPFEGTAGGYVYTSKGPKLLVEQTQAEVAA